MKAISIAQACSDMEAVLDCAQRERIVVTREGKPSAVIVGVESFDAEDIALASSSEFWGMIEQRRQGRSISLGALKARLKTRERKQTPKAANSIRKGHGKARRPKR